MTPRRRATQSEKNKESCRLRLGRKTMKLRATRGVQDSKASEIVIMSVITNDQLRWVGRVGAKNINGDIQLRDGTYWALYT